MKITKVLWHSSSDMVGDAVKDFLSLRYFVSILKYKEELLHAHVNKVGTERQYDVIIFPHDNPSCTCDDYVEYKKVCKHIIIAAFSTLMIH